MRGAEQAGKQGNVVRRVALVAAAGLAGAAALAVWRRRKAEHAAPPALELDWSATPVRFSEDVPAARIPTTVAGSGQRMVRLSADGRQIEKHVADGAFEAVALRGYDGGWRVGVVSYGAFGRAEDMRSEPVHTLAVPLGEVAATMVLGYQEPNGPFVAVPTRIDAYCAPGVMQQIHPETPQL